MKDKMKAVGAAISGRPYGFVPLRLCVSRVQCRARIANPIGHCFYSMATLGSYCEVSYSSVS